MALFSLSQKHQGAIIEVMGTYKNVCRQGNIVRCLKLYTRR